MSKARFVGIVVSTCFVLSASAAAGERFELTPLRAAFAAQFFALDHGAGNTVALDTKPRCPKRIALNVRRCTLHWLSRDRNTLRRAALIIRVVGRRDGLVRTFVAYRLRAIDVVCARTLPADECDSNSRGRVRYIGGG